MCFSEKQSYIHFTLLTITSMICQNQWRLSFPLLFLGIKDLLQGLLYRYRKNKKINRLLTSLSWIHICFQPLFVNMFLSFFDKEKHKYYSAVFLACFIYGVHSITLLEEFDIQNEPNCVDTNDDYCSTSTLSYLGKKHIAYKFQTDKNKILFPILYGLLMILPSMFTKAIHFNMLWIIFILGVRVYGKMNNMRNGEVSAIWCFLSVIFAVPIALIFRKRY